MRIINVKCCLLGYTKWVLVKRKIVFLIFVLFQLSAYCKSKIKNLVFKQRWHCDFAVINATQEESKFAKRFNESVNSEFNTKVDFLKNLKNWDIPLRSTMRSAADAI